MLCRSAIALVLVGTMLESHIDPFATRAADSSPPTRTPSAPPARTWTTEERLKQFPDLARVEHVLNAVPFQHDREINQIFFADGGRTLLASTYLGIQAWDRASQKVLRELPGKMCIAANGDATRLAVVGDDNSNQNRDDILVIEWPSGDEVTRFDGAALFNRDDGSKIRGRLFTAALSPDGSKFAAVHTETQHHAYLRIWDATSGKLLAERKGPGMPAICWTHDGQLLAVGEDRGTIIFLKPDGILVRPGIRFDPDNSQHELPLALAFDAANQRLAVVTPSGTCSVWTMADRSRVWEWRSPDSRSRYGHSEQFGGLIFDHDGRRLFARSAPRMMQFNANDGSVECEMPRWQLSATAIALSPDERTLVAPTWRCGLELIDVSTSSGKFNLAPEARPLEGIRVSPDGQLLAAWSDNNLSIYRGPTMSLVGEATLVRQVREVCWSRDGKQLALSRKSAGAKAAFVDLIDPLSGQTSKTLTFPEGAAGELAFTADSRRLAVDERHFVSLTEIDSGKTLWRVRVNAGDDTIERLAISLDGRTIAVSIPIQNFGRSSGGIDLSAPQGTVHLIDAETGEKAPEELTTQGLPTRLEFASNDTLLVAMGTGVQTVGRSYPVLAEWDVKTRRQKPNAQTPSLELNVIFEPILSFDRARNLVLLTGGADVHASKLVLWDLAKGSERQHLRLPGSLKDAQLFGQNHLVVVHNNGALMVLRLD